MEQGIFGVIVFDGLLIFLLFAAFLQPISIRRTLALFLIVYFTRRLIHSGRVRRRHDVPA